MHSRISISILSLALIAFSPAKAQWHTGLQGGRSYNTLLTNIDNLPSERYVSVYAWTAAIPVWYTWSSGISLNGELSFMQKNYQIWDTTTYHYGQNQAVRNNYLQLAFGPGYAYSIGKIFLAASAGFYGAYWLSSHIRGHYSNFFSADSIWSEYSYDTNYSFDSHKDRRWEWGWQVGGNVGYSFYKGYIANIGIRYYQSLTDQQKQYMLDQIPRYNRTWGFTLGVLKKLGRK